MSLRHAQYLRGRQVQVTRLHRPVSAPPRPTPIEGALQTGPWGRHQHGLVAVGGHALKQDQQYWAICFDGENSSHLRAVTAGVILSDDTSIERSVACLAASDQNWRDHSFGQRSTTTFFWVKNSTASIPWPCILPKNDPFHPLKGKKAIGAATPMFMPMFPASTS